MKKFINLLLLSIVAFAFLGCNQPTGPSEEELQKQREEQEKLELEQRILNRKKEIWKMIEGVWEIDSSSVGEWEKGTEYKNVIIATDSFTIDGVQQSINLDTDTVLESDLPVDDVYAYGYEIDLEDLSSFDSDTSEEFVMQYERYPFDEYDDAFYQLAPLETYLIPYIKANIDKF